MLSGKCIGASIYSLTLFLGYLLKPLKTNGCNPPSLAEKNNIASWRKGKISEEACVLQLLCVGFSFSLSFFFYLVKHQFLLIFLLFFFSNFKLFILY